MIPPLPVVFSKLDGLTRFLAPLLPAPQLEWTWGTPGRPSDTGAVSPATRSGNADYSSGAAPTCGLASSRETWPGQGHIV